MAKKKKKKLLESLVNDANKSAKAKTGHKKGSNKTVKEDTMDFIASGGKKGNNKGSSRRSNTASSKKSDISFLNINKGAAKTITGGHQATFHAIRNPMEQQYLAAQEVRKKRGENITVQGGLYDQLLNKERTGMVKEREKNLDKAFKKIDEGNRLIEEEKAKMGKAGKLATDVYVGGLGILSDALTGPFANASMASRVFGGTYKTAKEEGATDSQAALTGASIAGVEVGLGKVANIGAPFKVYGQGVADDAFEAMLKKAADKATSQATKNAIKYGGKTAGMMVGEGAEEMAAEVLEPAISNKIYAEETGTPHKTSAKEVAYAGLVGATLGGVLGGAGQVIEYRADKNNPYSNLSENEQKVVSKEIEKRTAEKQKKIAVENEINKGIAESEKTFGKLSESEKKRVREQVQTKIENGELDYTAVKLSKNENAEIEKQVLEDLNDGHISIDTIEGALSGEKTSRINELKKRLSETTKVEEKTATETELHQLEVARAEEMKGLLKKDGILQESYRQEAMKGQPFTREVTENDSDITKELIESAKSAGMNNTKKMHHLFEYANKIANDSKTKYAFVNTEQLQRLGHHKEGKTINGLVRVNEDGTSKVLINVDSKKAINAIIGHETTHLLEGTEDHKKLVDVVKEYATTKGDYDGRLKELTKLYSDTNANIENEVTADLIGDYLFTDKQFVQSLSAKEPNVFKKIYDYIKHAYKMATAGSTEARQLEQVKKTFDKAYRKLEKTTTKEVEKDVASEESDSAVIKKGMTDQQRYEVLKNKTVQAPIYNPSNDLEQVKALEELKDTYKSKAEESLKKLGEKLNVFKSYKTADIDISFNYSKSSMNESVFHQNERTKEFEDLGKMLTCIDEVIHNAVLIEIHNDKYIGTIRESGDLKQVYVLVSGFFDKGFIPVQLEVKEFYGKKDNKLYLTVTLSQIKKDAIVGQSSAESRHNYPMQPFTISIADIFNNINKDEEEFLKYIPDNFLDSEQKVGKAKGIEKERKKIEALKRKEKSGKEKLSLSSEGNLSRSQDVDTLIKEWEGYAELPYNRKKLEGMDNEEQIAQVEKDLEFFRTIEEDSMQLNEPAHPIKEEESIEEVKKDENIEEVPEDITKKTRKELQKELLAGESNFIIKALEKAKNIPMALMNNTDTIRNNELVLGREAGKKVNEAIFQKAIDNEARSIYWQNKQRADIKALGIKARSKESAAVQKYGEGEYINEAGDLVEYGDGALMMEFPDEATQEKIKEAARIIKAKYEQYIDKANEVFVGLGFDPIPKRKDYMRHFQELNDVFSKFGLPFNPQNMKEHTLPTDINGLTEFWSPQKNFFANIQPRKGRRTTLDAITGIDGYIGGIANLIFHTEDIQRGRAYEAMIRENFGQDRGWDILESLPEDEQLARAELIEGNHLSNYAAWVHEWTNNLAGKKNKIDRSVEAMFGRKGFTVLDTVRKQVGANMIGFNVASSLTNLISPIQAAAKTNKVALMKGTVDTFKNILSKDGFVDKNPFLTARFGTDMLSKTKWEKVTDAAYMFMKGIDYFSSNLIVRSKYNELIKKGMSEKEAHKEAGTFAARIMGDRTKGASAQLYNSKMLGVLTQFQLEVNNQLYSMFYDTYHESKESAKGSAVKTAAGMTFVLGQLFAFTHLFGKGFEAVAGYNPTFDVIGIIETLFGVGEDDDEEKTFAERSEAAIQQLIKSLPYSSILTGGRIPLGQALPIKQLYEGKDDYGNDKSRLETLKETLPYYLMPGGYGQIKKTAGGLKMFSNDKPVSGSYTDSGNLRFPVEETPKNIVHAAIFGQWASKIAQDYIDNERLPLKEKQIQEYKSLDMPIKDYWKYREGLSKQKTLEEKFDYVAGLDVSVRQKNIMINNIVNRDERVDMSDYDDYGSYEEFKFATEKPEEYAIAKAIGFDDYVTCSQELYDIRADKDKYGNSIRNSRKAKVIDYINNLDISYEAKLMLYKKEYPSDDSGNQEIIDYLNSRSDISYEDMESVLKELGFTVTSDGSIYW